MSRALACVVAALVGCAPAAETFRQETSRRVYRPAEAPRERILGIVAASEDNQTLATIYSLCSWMRKTPAVNQRYAGVFVVSRNADPLSTISSELTKAMTRTPEPGSASDPGAKRAYQQITELLRSTHELDKQRPEIFKCYQRDGVDPVPNVDVVVIGYVALAPYGAGASYLLLRDATSRRGYVPLTSREPDDNARALAAVAIAHEEDVIEVSASAAIEQAYLCKAESPEDVCLYQPGSLRLSVHGVPSPYADPHQPLTSAVHLAFTRDDAPADDDVELTPVAGPPGDYVVGLHLRRAGRYVVTGTFASGAVTRDIKLMSIVARPQAVMVDTCGDCNRAELGALFPSEGIRISATCRAGVIGTCTTMRSSLFEDDLVPRLQGHRVYTAASLAALTLSVRDALIHQTSPHVDDEVADAEWQRELARVLTDDELRIALTSRQATPTSWCDELLGRIVDTVTQLTGATPPPYRREQWSRGCAATVDDARDHRVAATGVKYLVFARGGATVFRYLQRLGGVEIDTSSAGDNAAFELSTEAVFDGKEEHAQVAARIGDEVSRPVDLWVMRKPTMRLATLGAGFSGWWHDGVHASVLLDASLRLPYEVGRLQVTYSNPLNNALPENGYDVIATLWIHPWCTASHRSKEISDICRPLSWFSPTVSWAFRERSLMFGFTTALGFVKPRITPVGYGGYRFARNPAAGISVIYGAGF